MKNNKRTLKNKIVVTSAMVGAVVAAPAIVGVVDEQVNTDLSGKIGLGELENKALAFEGGTGTKADPYLIGSATELNAIRNNLSAHYKLTKNVDLQGMIWEPIGTSSTQTKVFSGTLDGNGFAISNLAPSTAFKYQGLFGYISGATIKNLTLDGPKIQVPGSGAITSGTLFAHSSDELKIDNVHVKGAVFSNGYSSSRIGGLGGDVRGFSGYVKNVSVEIDAKTEAGYAGGLFSRITGTSKVASGNRILDNISVKGDIQLTGSRSASMHGGLAGEAAYASISNVVTNVDVTGYKNVGGVLGQASGDMRELVLNKVFAYGSVVAPSNVSPTTTTGSNVGGIVGSGDAMFRYVYAYNKKIEGNNGRGTVGRLAGKDLIHPDMYGNSFEIIEGNAHSLNVADVILQSEVFQKNQYDRFGFDFENTWAMVEGQSAPHLKIQDTDTSLYRTDDEIQKYSFSGGSGTVSDPYLIANADDIHLMATNTGAHFRLVADVDMEYVPITPTGTKYDPFTGSFDGNGFTLSNVNISSTSDYVGLFGYGKGAVVRNLIVNNINVVTNGSYVGGVVGYLDGGKLTNIHFSGDVNVTGDDFVGGMVGDYTREKSKITEKHSKLRIDNAVVKGAEHVGGVYGRAYVSVGSGRQGYAATIIDEVFVKAEVNATGRYVGGFAGQTRNAVLKNAVILGSVVGDSYVGGISNAPKTSYSGLSNTTSYPYHALTKFENVIAYNHVKGLDEGSINIGGGFGEFSSGTIQGVFLYNSSVDVGKIGAISKSWGIDSYRDHTVQKTVNGLFQYETIPGSAAVGYVDEIVDKQMVKDVEFYRANSTMDFGDKWIVTENGHPALTLNPKQADHTFTEDQEGSSQFAGGTGTVEDPFLIANVTQFNMIADNLKAHFKLASDIDFDYSVLSRVIGEKSTLSFEGSLDGNGFALKNINIQTTDDYQGIFGYVDKLASVKNLKIKGVTVSTAFGNTGVLAGKFDGNLQNVTFEDIEANVTKGGYFGVIAGRSSGSYDATTLEGNVQNVTIKNAKIVAPDTIDNIGGAFGNIASKLNAENVFVDANIQAGERVGIFAGSLAGAGTYKDIQTTGKVVGLSYLGGYAGYVSSGSTHDQIVAATDLVGGPKAEDFIGGLVGSSTNSGTKYTGVYSFSKEVQGSKSATVGKAFGKTSTSSSFMPIYVNVLSTMVGGHSTHVTNSLTPTQIMDKASFSRSGMMFNEMSNWEHEPGFIPYLKESKSKLALGSSGWQQNVINTDAQFVSAAQALIDQAFSERNATILDSALIEINKIESDDYSKTNLINQMNEVKQFIKASNAVKKVWQTFKTAHYNLAVEQINAVSNSSWRATLTDELGNALETIEEQTHLLGIANTLIDAAEVNKTKENVALAQSAIDVLRESEGKTAAQSRLNSVLGAIEMREEVEQKLDYLEKRIASTFARQIYSTTLALIKEASTVIDVTVYDQRMIQAYIDLQMIEKNQDIFYEANDAVEKAEGSNTLKDVEDAQNKVDLLPDGNTKDMLQDRLDVIYEKLGVTDALDSAIKKAQNSMDRVDYDAANTLFGKLTVSTDISKYTPLMKELLTLIESAELVTEAEKVRTQESVDTARAKLNELPKTYPNWTTLDERLKAIEKELASGALLIEAEEAVVKAEGSLLAEDVDVAQKLVTALPDAPEEVAIKKTELQDRLDVIIAQIQAKEDLEKAEEAVKKTEETVTRADADAAQDLVDKLPAGPEKDALQDRLDVIFKTIEDEESKLASIEEATNAVEKAESSKADTDINDAQKKVTALPEGDVKTDLQDRLDKLKAEKEDKDALEDATKAVEKAESTKSTVDIDAAQKKVTALKDSSEKDALQDRLDKLKTEIEADGALAEATKAVEKAEGSKTLIDINDAQSKVTALKDSLEKKALQDRLDALKAEIEAGDVLAEATKAVEKAESTKATVDVDDAQQKVTALKDSPEKDTLQDRLDKLKVAIEADGALAEATKVVEKAEGSKTLVDVDDAQAKVTALKDSPEKQALQDRLDKLKAELEDAGALEKATKAVDKAEATHTQDDLNSAQDLVAKLDDSPEKDALQDRLDALQTELNAIDEATKAVEKAEGSLDKTDADAAQKKVTALKDSPEKDALQDRLDVLFKTIEDEEAELASIEEATKAVEKAEGSKADVDIDDAQSKVSALPESDIKADLQDRLDKLKAEKEDASALEAATKAVEKAESSKSKTDIDAAQKKVTALKDSPEKQALQDRLDKLGEELNAAEEEAKALEDAKNAVDKAETSKDESDIKDAQDKIDALPEGKDKNDLQDRLDKVKEDIADDALFEKLAAEVKVINKGILDGKIGVAEFEKTKTKLESIRQEGAAIKNADNKDRLNALIDATLELMNLVEKIEAGDKSPETIDQLPDSKIKDDYLSEIAAADAIAQAEKAVVQAEKTVELADIEAAEDLVSKLAPSDKKEELKERLKVVRDKYEEQQLIDRATALVEQAESTKRITDIERAEDVVKQLKDGDVKTGLQDRLDVLRKAIDNAELEAATKAVEKAEELKSNVSIGYAKDKVNALHPSPEKDALLDRIAALEKAIYDQSQMDRLYKQALEAVIKAENSTIVAYLNTAIKLVGKVSDADERKQDLVDRLNAVILRNQIASVDAELGRLELRPSQGGVEKVQGLINKLPDAVAEKEAFQNRLDAVKRALDNENYEKALKGVEFAESAKIERKRAAYYSALPLVDVLLDSERKTALEERLAKVLAEVEAYEKLDGDYNPGDSVVKSAQSIKDDKVKPSLLAWAEAVEDAERYNSSVMVKTLVKAEQSVSQEILDNEKYADLIKELIQRSAHVKESSKVFGGLVARGSIKKAYVAVLTFENDRTEANKEVALKLIDSLKRFKGHEGQVEKLIERVERIEIVEE